MKVGDYLYCIKTIYSVQDSIVMKDFIEGKKYRIVSVNSLILVDERYYASHIFRGYENNFLTKQQLRESKLKRILHV